MYLGAAKRIEKNIKRVYKIIDFGEYVEKRGLEIDKVNDFNHQMEIIIKEVVELKEVAREESAEELVTPVIKEYASMKKNLIKLVKKSQSVNGDIDRILKSYNKFMSKKKKTKEYMTKNIKLFEKSLKKMVSKQPELNKIQPTVRGVVEAKYTDDKEDVELLEEDLEKLGKEIENLKVKNHHLKEAVSPFLRKLDDMVFVYQDEVIYKDYVMQGGLTLDNSVSEIIGQNLVMARDANAFMPNMKEGNHLVNFKNGKRGKGEFITYGTDVNLKNCRQAIDNGVDHVAKIGLKRMSNNVMDMAVLFKDDWQFFTESEESVMLPFYEDMEELFHANALGSLKPGGYMILNMPYFRVKNFAHRLKKYAVENVYRVDDDLKNVVIVARMKLPTKRQLDLVDKIPTQYNSFPHISEMEPIKIDSGEMKEVEIFRAIHVEQSDIMREFEEEKSPVDFMQDFYRPEEKVQSLNRPLQEYKEGHLPAVATIEIVNGIYEFKGNANLYCTKIVQQDVEDEEEKELPTGEVVKEISSKKKNVIVSKTLLPNGEIHELLKTK